MLWLVISYYLFAGLLIVFVVCFMKGLAHTPWRKEEGDETDQMGYEHDEFGKEVYPGLDTYGYEEQPDEERTAHPHVEALGH